MAFSPVFPITSAGAAPVSYPWYACEGLGEELCVAAYKPIGAANIGASYTNLVNPGTYDCTNPGGTPAWSAGAGWICGADSYILTGPNEAGSLKPYYGMSFLIRYSSWSTVTSFGVLFGTEDNFGFVLNVGFESSKVYLMFGNFATTTLVWGTSASSGTIIVTPNDSYIDGTPIGATLGLARGGDYRDGPLYFGCQGSHDLPPSFFSIVNIQAFALYTADITPFVSILTTQAQNLT
jgi:hypothetical protein